MRGFPWILLHPHLLFLLQNRSSSSLGRSSGGGGGGSGNLPVIPAGAASDTSLGGPLLEPVGRRWRRGLELWNTATTTAHLGEGIWTKGVGAEGVVRQEAAVAGLGVRRVAVGAVEEGGAAETRGGRGRGPRRGDLHPPGWFTLMAV